MSPTPILTRDFGWGGLCTLGGVFILQPTSVGESRRDSARALVFMISALEIGASRTNAVLPLLSPWLAPLPRILFAPSDLLVGSVDAIGAEIISLLAAVGGASTTALVMPDVLSVPVPIPAPSTVGREDVRGKDEYESARAWRRDFPTVAL